MNRPSGSLTGGLLTEQRVTVRMDAASASTLFTPQRVRTLIPAGDLIPYFNLGSELFTTRNLEAGDTWSVDAPLMLGGDAGMATLLSACAAVEDARYQEMESLYLQVPDHLEEPVWALMIEATAGAQTPYEKAFAIQNWLTRNYRYTLEPPLQPSNADFMTYFLLTAREGYCTYFATAMTMLCRMAGLPARYVEGYVATPDAQGIARVTGLDAHAWTEVYFAGFGWLTFDATPGEQGGGGEDGSGAENATLPPAEEPSPEPSAEPEGAAQDAGEDAASPSPEASDEPTEEPAEEPTEEPTEAPAEEPTENATDSEPDGETPEPEPSDAPDRQRSASGFPWWLLALAALAAAGGRIARTAPALCARRAKTEEDRWAVWVQALYDALHVLRLDRRREETLGTHLHRVDRTRRFQAPTAPVGEAAARLYYAHKALQPQDTQDAKRAWEAANAALRPWQKIRLFLLRVCTPAAKHRFYSS